MKIMVTGAHGLLGRKTIQRLNSMDKAIIVIPTKRDDCNLNSYDETFEHFVKHAPDVIIHCAAVMSGIAANSKNPSMFFRKNQQIDQNVIWAAYEANVSKVVLIGSSSMYPPSDSMLPESAFLKGFPDPGNFGYALSKIMTCQLALMLNHQNKTQYRVLVAPNLYGVNDRVDMDTAHLLTAIAQKIKVANINKAPEVTMWGDGSARREFLFVDDLADYLTDYVFWHFDDLPSLLNVGTGEDHSILEYYLIGARLIGWEGEILPDTSKPSGARRKLLNSELAMKKFNWKPTTSIETGMHLLLQEIQE